MLKNPRRESLAGKLLLSSALVAVSLGFGWWQKYSQPRPAVAMFVPPAPEKLAPPVKPVTPDVAAPAVSIPAPIAPPAQKQSPAITAAAPPATARQTDTSTVSTPPPLTSQESLAMNLPSEEGSPAFPPVTGAPAPGATPLMQAGTHLVDGDYLSDKHQFEWGDLVVKISIQDGLISSVQILQYPDHRSQSLYLSQMAGPTLASEVIKTQQAKVDAVSSATDTSYAFQDAISSALMKATRG